MRIQIHSPAGRKFETMAQNNSSVVNSIVANSGFILHVPLQRNLSAMKSEIAVAAASVAAQNLPVRPNYGCQVRRGKRMLDLPKVLCLFSAPDRTRGGDLHFLDANILVKFLLVPIPVL